MYHQFSVLFVDDDVNILSSLKRGLFEEEYKCHFAVSAKQAFEIMEHEKIAVVVSDLRMPETDGLKLLKEIKERWPLTVKIVLSGYSQVQQVLATINQVDIFRFITKPWKLDEEFKHEIYKALDYYKILEESEQNKIALEKKNQAYINILRSIDSTIAHAKKSSEILAECGKNIIISLRNFEKGRDEEILELRQNIFEAYSKAVLGNEKDYKSELLSEEIPTFITNILKEVRVDVKLESGLKLMLNLNMWEATLFSLLHLFKEEFETFRANFILGLKEGKFLSLLIYANKVFKNKPLISAKGLTSFGSKIEFANSVIGGTIKLDKMNLVIGNNAGNLIIEVSVTG